MILQFELLSESYFNVQKNALKDQLCLIPKSQNHFVSSIRYINILAVILLNYITKMQNMNVVYLHGNKFISYHNLCTCELHEMIILE